MSGERKRGGHCAAGRHYDCSGHLGCDCECHEELPTPVSGDAATELLREIREALHRHESGSGWDGCPSCSARADVVLGTAAVRRLLADRQAVQRVETLADQFDDRARACRDAQQRAKSTSERDAYAWMAQEAEQTADHIYRACRRPS